MLPEGGDVHSASEQHPPGLGTHLVVPGQFLNPVAQLTPQVAGEPVHTAMPFEGGAVQELQPAPQ